MMPVDPGDGTKMPPCFSYYGGKHRAAGRYPPPEFDTIIESFAGSAGYSHRYWWKDVILLDVEPNVVAAWQWLIDASYDDVMALPMIEHNTRVCDYDMDYGAQVVVAHWCQSSHYTPVTVTPNKWCREHDGQHVNWWGQACRQRLAENVHKCDHWQIIDASYGDAPDVDATWFVDPPYNNKAGSYYKCGPDGIDYTHLADWCQSRRGQVIVCENEGADWLPFETMYETIGACKHGNSRKRSVEVVWTNGDTTNAA